MFAVAAEAEQFGDDQLRTMAGAGAMATFIAAGRQMGICRCSAISAPWYPS